jgi:hypothetical protein
MHHKEYEITQSYIAMARQVNPAVQNRFRPRPLRSPGQECVGDINQAKNAWGILKCAAVEGYWRDSPSPTLLETPR